MTVFVFRLDPECCQDRRVAPSHHNRGWGVQREQIRRHRSSTMEGKGVESGAAWDFHSSAVRWRPDFRWLRSELPAPLECREGSPSQCTERFRVPLRFRPLQGSGPLGAMRAGSSPIFNRSVGGVVRFPRGSGAGTPPAPRSGLGLRSFGGVGDRHRRGDSGLGSQLGKGISHRPHNPTPAPQREAGSPMELDSKRSGGSCR